MKIFVLGSLLLVSTLASGQTPEAHMSNGTPLYPMPLPPEQQAKLEADLAAAQAVYDLNPSDPENVIWLGRRLGYLWRYRDAIKMFTKGIEAHPGSFKLYRHRGHRYISVREFDKAIADLEKAAALIRDVPDEVEPDGAPNKEGKPRSTSHSNIWYHLGLAYYLKGDFENARRAYVECMKFSTVNDDMLVATSDWLYMIYRRLGRAEDAKKVLEPIREKMDVIENFAYHKRLLMYKGLVAPESLLDTSSASDLDVATQGYGVGNWYLVNGNAAKAREIFERIVKGKYWSAFGFIAAEADLPRIPPASPSTDVYVVDVTRAGDRLVFGEPWNTTDREGYDNQPYFAPDGKSFLYTSQREGQNDVYRYGIAERASRRVTETPESEYSPTFVPGGNGFSCIRVEADGTQRLWKFDLAGKNPALVLENVKPVGYHAWVDENTLVLFVLGSPATLQIADVRTGKAEVVASSIGRSLHLFAKGKRQVSFVHTVAEKEWWIKLLDVDSRAVTPLARTLPGSEDYAWIGDDLLLMGQGSKLFTRRAADAEWKEVADFTGKGVEGITRIAVSPARDRLALVGNRSTNR